jgi:hypothetical protein
MASACTSLDRRAQSCCMKLDDDAAFWLPQRGAGGAGVSVLATDKGERGRPVPGLSRR